MKYLACPRLLRFNSTLVRLEATTETSLIGTGVFQFHFGSIGSDCEKSWGKYKSEFQFHFGSIGSNDCINLAVIKSVSIPLWFDWKQIRKVLHLYRIRFNSTLVRLEDLQHRERSRM